MKKVIFVLLMSVCTCLFAETVIIETKLPNPITEVVISEFSQNNVYEIKTFKQINGKDTIKINYDAQSAGDYEYSIEFTYNGKRYFTKFGYQPSVKPNHIIIGLGKPMQTTKDTDTSYQLVFMLENNWAIFFVENIGINLNKGEHDEKMFNFVSIYLQQIYLRMGKLKI